MERMHRPEDLRLHSLDLVVSRYHGFITNINKFNQTRLTVFMPQMEPTSYAAFVLWERGVISRGGGVQ